MVGNITVVNKKTFKTPEKGKVIDISRPNILGNPFKMENEDQRELVCIKFYHYLREEYKKKGQIYDELIRIKDMVKSGKDIYLECWCAPKMCHGDIIKNAILGMLSREKA